MHVKHLAVNICDPDTSHNDSPASIRMLFRAGERAGSAAHLRAMAAVGRATQECRQVSEVRVKGELLVSWVKLETIEGVDGRIMRTYFAYPVDWPDQSSRVAMVVQMQRIRFSALAMPVAPTRSN